jgi:DNA-binding GntR family transcriptional regulator
MLSKTPPLPKYYQLAQTLSDQISTGALKPNDQLPTEGELSQRYGLSRGPVREAMRLSENDGLVRRERDRGTFVSDVFLSSSLFSLMPFIEAMRRQSRVPTTRVLKATILPATAEVAKRLAIEVDKPVMHIVLLRLADNQSVVYEERYLAHALCPQLLGEDLAESSIHTLIVFRYGVPLVKMTRTVEAGRLLADQATHVQMNPGDCAFIIDRLTLTEEDDIRFPAVWFQGIYRESSFDLKASLPRSL